MWDLDWQQSGYTRKFMLKVLSKCDYLYLRSHEHVKPVENFFDRLPDGINENFDLKDFYKL